MSNFQLSKRENKPQNAADEIILSKRAQVPGVGAAKKTAESLFKIIQFIFFRIPNAAQRNKLLSRLRGKLVKIHPGTISFKKPSPGASLGQSIVFIKAILSGLAPAFTQNVLIELTKLLSVNIGPQPLIPPGAKKPK
jgi:hypothetical protein